MSAKGSAWVFRELILALMVSSGWVDLVFRSGKRTLIRRWRDGGLFVGIVMSMMLVLFLEALLHWVSWAPPKEDSNDHKSPVIFVNLELFLL